MDFQRRKELGQNILKEWLDSCTRNKKIARNTVAIGIVVIYHLRRSSSLSRSDVISRGGEVSGARSGLGLILESFGIPRQYLKEVTTRQAHQDGQRLFEQFEWGSFFSGMSDIEHNDLIQDLIGELRNIANEWLKRQNLKLDIDRRESPTTWVNIIIENAKGRSGGVVEQHLVGAKLARRFRELNIPNHPAHAGDRQTERTGDFSISKLIYHVTSAPSRDVIRKCIENVRVGTRPILLVPREQMQKALYLAQDEGVYRNVDIISIEEFVAQNIFELATEADKDPFNILQEIIEIYNHRLAEVETDLSLRIEVH